MKEKDLLNAVATYNADPYCVETEEMAKELYNDICGNYEEITDPSGAIDAAEKLDIKPYMQVRHIYEFKGGYFALNDDIYLEHIEPLAFSEKQWDALKKIEPDIFYIERDDLPIIANIANKWFASYKIDNLQIASLKDLGNAIIAGKIDREAVADICRDRIGWIKCEKPDYDDSDIAIDLIRRPRGERLQLTDDGFEVVENSREIKYKGYWMTISEDSQYYYIKVIDGAEEKMYSNEEFTLEQALEFQLHLDDESYEHPSLLEEEK